MHTIKLELNENLYKILVEKNIDIQKKLGDYLYFLAKNEHKTVNQEEAETRVKNAFNRYKNDKNSFKAFDEDYKNSLLNIIESV